MALLFATITLEMNKWMINNLWLSSISSARWQSSEIPQVIYCWKAIPPVAENAMYLKNQLLGWCIDCLNPVKKAELL